jgi:hypothetical protein
VPYHVTQPLPARVATSEATSDPVTVSMASDLQAGFSAPSRSSDLD